LGTYIFGYAISLLITGVPNILYLVPIKVMGLIFSILLGNAFYERKEVGISFWKLILLNLKNSIICVIIVLFILIIKDIALSYNIDMAFILGPF